MDTIRVLCKNNGANISVEPGTNFYQLAEILGYADAKIDGMPILAAYSNHVLKHLSQQIYKAQEIEFITYSNPDGRRCYRRTINFLVQKVVRTLYPDAILYLNYNLPNGQFGELRCRENPKQLYKITDEDVAKIKSEVKELIAQNHEFQKTEITQDEARNLFINRGQTDKARLLDERGDYFITMYYLDGYIDTFYGPLIYSTGQIDRWNIFKYQDGFCIQVPSAFPPHKMADQKKQKHLSEIFAENAQWMEILGAKDIGSVNKGISKGYGAQIINLAEALHSRKYAQIADMVYSRKDKVKMVLIAGPSSSGKTTTSLRIAIQLKVLGLNPIVIGMDDYFVERERTPKDENGDYDFESVYALDLELLNTHLNMLFEGKEVQLPKFNFAAGCSTPTGAKIQMKEGDILVMEGIHALNPVLTEKIDNSLKFKVYASALTSLAIDENNYISTTDNRELRRMVRDNNFRGIGAEDTILRWGSVVNGENKNIFPYQENADVMFNSSLIYELPMLKFFAEPLLRRISPVSPAYAESLRLLNFLKLITPLTPQEINNIPPTSIMREFIGGSSLSY